jgi:hypothetical protein
MYNESVNQLLAGELKLSLPTLQTTSNPYNLPEIAAAEKQLFSKNQRPVFILQWHPNEVLCLCLKFYLERR